MDANVPTGHISLANVSTLDFQGTRNRRRFIAQVSKQRRGREPKESNFFITINLNKPPHNQQEAAYWQQAFALALQNLFLRKTTLESVLTFGPKDAEFAFDRYDQVIESVKANMGVEFGPQTLFLHAHVLLSIRHRSQVQLNLPLIKEYIHQRVNSRVPGLIGGPREIYLNVKLMPEDRYQDQMARYVTKQSEPAYQRGSQPGSHEFAEAEHIKQETVTNRIF